MAWLEVVDRYVGVAEVREDYGEVTASLTVAPVVASSLRSLAADERGGASERQGIGAGHHSAGSTAPLGGVAASRAAELVARAERLIARVEALADAMNLRFLYNSRRRLFPVGYNVDEQRFDSSYYDLLASEARLASLVAVARGDVPAEHWFALGRLFGRAQGHRVLFSWSGTMFEYLMPLLLVRELSAHALGRGLTGRRLPSKSTTVAGRASPGVSPSRPSPPSTLTRSTSIRPSASQAWGSSVGSPKTWSSRRMRARSP